MKKIAKTVLFLLLFSGAYLPTPGKAGAGEVNWFSYPEGLTRAARTQRPVLVFFYARACRVCSVMDQKVFGDQRIADYLNANLVPVRVNNAEERELVRRYRVFGVPTVHFLKPDSAPLDFLAGYVEPEKFMTIIRYIGDKAYEKMPYGEYLKKNGK